jgi:CheY-like chemotaxis protein/HPt (histidine-containing phosphotransfer) domain-containing protein
MQSAANFASSDDAARRRVWSWTALGVVFVVASWVLGIVGDAWPGSLGALHRQNLAYFLIDLAPLALYLMARTSAHGGVPPAPTRPQPSPVSATAARPTARPVMEPSTFRVLVTDDNAVNRRVATLMLRKAGYEVVEAADGQEAVQRVSEGSFDVVLMDVQMPGMDGLAATRVLRHREDGTHRLPILAMTGQTLEGDAQACLEAGMDGYVSKPVRSITLLAAVESWARQGRSPIREQSSTDDAPVDHATLEELRSYGGDSPEDILEELTTMFLEGAHKHLTAMREALQQRDAVALEQAAHTLKGSAATLGAQRLAALCFDLENEARQGRLPADGRPLDRLHEEIEVVREYMSREVGVGV